MEIEHVARIETGHQDIVYDAKLNHFGNMLATCSSDKLIKIFEVHPSKETFLVAELSGHSSAVWQLAWAHPKFGEILASCSHDSEVIVWMDCSGTWNNDWRKVYEYSGHIASVMSICWSPHEYGLILLCGSLDTTFSVLAYDPKACIWNVRRIFDAHCMGCTSVSWAPAISRCKEPGEASLPLMRKRLVSGGNDFMVKIWRETDEGNFELEHTLKGHSHWVRDVAWSPPTSTTMSTIASCGEDKKALIWRSKNVDEGQWISMEISSFDVPLWHVSWSPCATLLSICGANNLITCWTENPENVWTRVPMKRPQDSGDHKPGDGNTASSAPAPITAG